jgi:hypothetical protein
VIVQRWKSDYVVVFVHRSGRPPIRTKLCLVTVDLVYGPRELLKIYL